MVVEQKDSEYYKLQYQEDLKNKKEELDRLKKVVVENDEILKEMEEVLELMEKGMKVMKQYPKIVRPVFEFEEKEEYWNYIARARELDMKRKYYLLRDREVPGMRRDVIIKREQVETLTSQIASMEGA